MAATKTLLLNDTQTRQKIKRIAIEIYEQNFEETEIVLAGIFDRGYKLAEHLMKNLQELSPLKVSLVKINLDKASPLQSEITLDAEPSVYEGKVIILIDDVQNTGRTFAYSLKPFLLTEIKKIQTAVLVDRDHKSFPISADFIGYSLSTTLAEHVEVTFGKKLSVHLTY